MTAVHRLVLMIIDHDGLGAPGVREALEAPHYPNDCITPNVVEITSERVAWYDGHPLNKSSTWRKAFAALFTPQIAAPVVKVIRPIEASPDCEVYDQISDRACRYFADHGGKHNFARLDHNTQLERHLRYQLDVMTAARDEACAWWRAHLAAREKQGLTLSHEVNRLAAVQKVGT